MKPEHMERERLAYLGLAAVASGISYAKAGKVADVGRARMAQRLLWSLRMMRRHSLPGGEFRSLTEVRQNCPIYLASLALLATIRGHDPRPLSIWTSIENPKC